MKRLLFSFGALCVLFICLPQKETSSQTFGVARATSLGSGVNQLVQQVQVYGGILFDFRNNDFVYQQPGGSLTRYSDFAALFSAFSGTASSSSKWIYNSDSVLVQTSPNTVAQPCFTGAGEIRGICMENAATNSVLHSATFTNGVWQKTGVSLVADNRISPVGTLSASTITEDITTGNHWVLQSTTKAASALGYVASCHVGRGAGDRSAVLYVDDGAGNGAYAIFAAEVGEVPVPLGVGAAFSDLRAFVEIAGSSSLVRIALSYTSNSATTLRFACGMASSDAYSYTGDGTSGLAIWGMQNEQNSISSTQTTTAPSSYIPTSAVAITRAIDRIAMTLPASLQGLSSYSEFLNVRLQTVPNGLINTFTALLDSTRAENLSVIQNNPGASGSIGIRIDAASTVSVTTLGPLNTYDQSFGIAAVFKASQYWVGNSGQGVRTNVSSVYPTLPMSEFRLGSYSSTSTTLTGNVGFTQVALFAGQVPTTTLQSLLFPAPPANPDVIIPPPYFTQAMINDVLPTGREVFRQSRMPSSDAETNATFVNYPLSIAYSASIPIANTSTASLTKFAWIQWGNRCNLCPGAELTTNNANTNVPAFNTSLGKPTRNNYTTYEKANAATLASALKVLGFPAHASGACAPGITWCGYLDVTAAAGIPDSDVIDWSVASSTPDIYYTIPSVDGRFMTATDIVVLSPGTLGSGSQAVYGILGDNEQNDQRLASVQLDLLTQLARLTQSKGFKYATVFNEILPNPLNGISSGTKGGFCGVGVTAPNCDIENLNTLANTVDAMLISNREPPPAGYTFNGAISARQALFGAPSTYPSSSLIAQMNVGLWPGGTTLADGQVLHDWVTSQGLGGYAIANEFWTPGGDQCRYSNLKIALMLGLSTGACPLSP